MNWKTLYTEKQLEELRERSATIPQVIFKHSTRCSISAMAKSRLDRSPEPDGIEFHYLDLLANRQLSNKISEIFHVYHESPQVLVIVNDECVYDESHSGISMDLIVESAKVS
jgi:bacillithiol system protein YtxJ